VLVGSHDTASAVAAIPAGDEPFAYISSGTWSLVGVELEAPLLSEFGRLGGFTNEGGVDGKTRFLHNVMGLWLLNESLRQWEREGSPESIDRLLEEASVMPDGGPVFNVNDETFLTPGDMATRIATHCERAGRPIVGGRPGLVRAILDSLARAYAGTLRAASDLTGVTPRVLHVVGGGSQNELLCRLTANLCGLTVIAGPVEATAIGNVLVQARALGLIEGGLSSIRALVRASSSLKTYEPRPSLSATR